MRWPLGDKDYGRIEQRERPTTAYLDGMPRHGRKGPLREDSRRLLGPVSQASHRRPDPLEARPIDARVERAAAFRLDARGAEVRAAFEAHGVTPILLKGRGFEALLYDDHEIRPTSDVDLLIDPQRLGAAEAELVELGYEVDAPTAHLSPEPPHARHWKHTRHHVCIDLHVRLAGTRAPEQEVWIMLCEHAVPMLIGGRPGLVLDPTASAMLCALHRAHHVLSFERPSEDLRRAVERLDLTTWYGANELADRLGAAEAFASGLQLCESGAELAERLGLSSFIPTARRLAAQGASGAVLLEWLWESSWRRRARLVWRGTFPTAHTMRRFHPLSRRGRAGLAAAYVLRPVDVAIRFPRAVLHLLHARRR